MRNDGSQILVYIGYCSREEKPEEQRKREVDRQDAEVRIPRCCTYYLLQYYCRLEFCLNIQTAVIAFCRSIEDSEEFI